MRGCLLQVRAGWGGARVTFRYRLKGRWGLEVGFCVPPPPPRICGLAGLRACTAWIRAHSPLGRLQGCIRKGGKRGCLNGGAEGGLTWAPSSLGVQHKTNKNTFFLAKGEMQFGGHKIGKFGVTKLANLGFEP